MKRWSILLLSLLLAYFALRSVTQHPSASRGRSEREVARSGALEALDFWSASRAYPLPDIPADRYYRAYVAAKMKFTDAGRELNASDFWEPIGPFNLQGRSKSVAINPQNPNTVFLGTASSGLWRTRTGIGGDWQQVRLGYPALGINAIAIDPGDSNVIYLGTGEVYRYGGATGGLVIRTTRGSYGIGVLKSTDGGTTWTKSIDWSYQQQRGVQRIAINPLNPHTVFAATTEGIFKTTDAGESWTNVLSVVMGQDLIIHASDTNRIIASCGNFNSPGYGVYRSTDGGQNWLLLSGLPAFSGKTMLGAYAGDNDVVYASVADSTTGVGSLWKSTDFGSYWTMCSDYTSNSIFGSQGWYSHYPVVHPTNPSVVVHNSVGLTKSFDGGLSFTGSAGGYSDNHSYAIHPTNPDVIYIVNDDGIYRSTNFGDSYENIGAGLQTGQLYAGLACSASDSNIALVQSQDHIPGYRYTGSFTWDHGAASDEAGWTAIDPTNDSRMYCISRFGQVVSRSTDRGESFTGVVSLGTTGAWNSPIVVAPSNPAVLFVGKQRIYKSTNYGANWAATNSNVNVSVNPCLSMAVAPTSHDTVYIGMAPLYLAAQLFRTTNGGTNWTNVTGSLPNRYPLDLAVDPTDSRIVYAAFGGFGGGHVFRSSDAGGSWNDISGTLPDVPTGAVAVDPFNPQILYAGNDIGVYVSTDAGNTWQGYSDGLPDAVIVSDLTVSPSNHALRVGTHGNGVFERNLYHGAAPPAFDYRPLTFLHPADGSEVLVGSVVGGFALSVRNSGSAAQVDSCDVQFRILDGGNAIYTATVREPGLGFTEIRALSFPGQIMLGTVGSYTLEAVVIAGDQNPLNDTLRGTLHVIDPSITHTVATRQYRPYTEISGGTAGPSGDDTQIRIALPFAFPFDGVLYDSLQISTNGWVEFGTGQAGSVNGLSTPGQLGGIGANENGRLGWKDRPTKAIGVWWEDLNTDPAGSAVTYTTLGSGSARVVVVQWKNLRAYFDASVTTILNFQLRLYESTGGIELSYGPVTAGTFAGGDIGAMIGLKDSIGGSYHYFDLARNGTGAADDVVTDLSPLTDWPGPDTSIVIGSVTQAAVDMHLPLTFTLEQNYPNPFNPSTVIRYTVPAAAHVRLSVFNRLGQLVELAVDRVEPAGEREIVWRADGVASGVYFYRLEMSGLGGTGETRQIVKKMVVLK